MEPDEDEVPEVTSNEQRAVQGVNDEYLAMQGRVQPVPTTSERHVNRRVVVGGALLLALIVVALLIWWFVG